VANLLELLAGELRLERMDEPDCRLARRVGDDVKLDRLSLRPARSVAAPGGDLP